MRMLAKNPEERWPSMAQAIAALGAVSLTEDDPRRAELSRLASAGIRRAEVPLEQRTPSQAITILLPPPGLEVGDTFLLVARVHDGEGGRLPSRPVEWSSDAPGVLRVNPTRAVATAIAPGSAVILAVSEGKEGRLRITVAPTRADTIVVKSLEKPITTGERVQLEATARDKRGQILARAVSWRSEDDPIASVTPSGMLIARASGSTIVTAELDDARAELAVTVLPTSVAAVHISPPPETV